MRLTRRDAIAALAATGVTVGGGAVLLSSDQAEQDSDENDTNPAINDTDITTLVTAAEVLYPSTLENIEDFVTQYVRGRANDRPAHAREIADAIAYLDEYADAWYDTQFATLELPAREEALRQMGADTAEPVPDGSDVERVRYYVINELLFALYTTPTGGELVGLDNPQGHPGGLASYQRGPQS
jgi:hypothetical protein